MSWYEAAAYAAFRGRSLPTVYHWALAAMPDAELVEPLAPHIGPQSNLEGEGPAPVASHPGLSAAGAADMAGNVSEWVWNASGENRFLLGGSWEDPEYNFVGANAASPWRRRATEGFRLATYAQPPAERYLGAVDRPHVDYFRMAPSSDAEAEFSRRSAAYDRTPLHVREEGALDLPMGGRAQRVTLDGAYRGERLPVYVILPEGVAPPYQAVVFMGGANILLDRSTEHAITLMGGGLDFLRKSGRMVVMPVYGGTLERNDGSSLQRNRAGPISRREMRFEWSKDLGRTLDYLEARGDVDMEHVGFLGVSLGATAGLRMARFEERIATLILMSGGFGAAVSPEEAPDFVRAVEETTIPVLMLTGRHDPAFPYASHQVPFFERLGTPPEQKRHVVWDAGHLGFPIGEFLRENLDWLDQRLGPVARAD